MSALSQVLHGLRLRDASSRLALVIVCAGVVLASLDLFIVNVALPGIARDLHAGSLGDLSWVLNAYAIVYAALLVLFGRLAERRSRQHGFLLGVAIFTLASAACGLATSVPMLVAFRVVQAAGAALLTPTSLGLVLATTAPERRPGAVRAWTAVGGAAAAIGPVVGGLLVAASWRWVFLVNVPIGLLALVIGWRRLPDVPGHPVPRPDALGAVLVTGGIALLTLGLVEGESWGWGSARTIAALAVSVAALAAFVTHCRRHRNPLIDGGLFRVRAFTGASLALTLFSMAFGAMLLSIVLWDQEVWGWSALRTGLAVAPGPVMVPLFSFLVAGRLIARFGPGPVAGAGAALFAGGSAWWALAVRTHPDYVGGMLGGMLLTGVGVGLTLPTLMATAAGSLPAQAFATGSAVVNMLRQVGLAVGVAVLVAVLGSPSGAAGRLTAYRHGWWVIAGFALIASAAALVVLAAPRRAPVAAAAVTPSA
ncbi:DHA2 family efflux MFS transporter permease subunit [Baekduia soli]|uniref:DHA2 family efflux MFS transporter permease subunit n=1 Tax=Baekduia soli TaxID=496014 RepID=A0A5B8UCJ6_9ACTN|nr:DHA2 family efflux MFS transporter permease subunit [Baekduia soli]QEC50391.1 DHA2 family efflux MFS transporter permease subunit [Baekduia soli]